MSQKTFASDKRLPTDGRATKTAYVVLVVEGELLERSLAATRLRKLGCDVIEAADGDAARRVLDSVHVDVVFADLAMPGQTSGLALLRWLRERYPAIKTILTSDAETNIAALGGYGIFLSKPYRVVDLDYCLQKVLGTASIPGNEAGEAITAGPSTKTQPVSAIPSRQLAPDKADGRDDEVSKSLMAELSRRLRERAAQQQAVDPAAAKAARRAALQAYDRARARRLRLVLGVAVCAVVVAGIASLGPTIGSLSTLTSSSTTVHTEQASPVEMAAAAPVPSPPDSASPSSAPSSSPTVAPAAAQLAPAAHNEPGPASSGSAAPSPLPPPASLASAGAAVGAPTEAAPATASEQILVESTPYQAPLRRDEAREVQARLRSFGFNPGWVDGVPGPTTRGAVMHYQQDRGQPQTGTVDRQLLEQLRQDPAPQLALRATRPVVRTTGSPAPRRSDVFGSVRLAGDRFSRWLDSLGR